MWPNCAYMMWRGGGGRCSIHSLTLQFNHWDTKTRHARKPYKSLKILDKIKEATAITATMTDPGGIQKIACRETAVDSNETAEV